jgi:hypothetical protein
MASGTRLRRHENMKYCGFMEPKATIQWEFFHLHGSDCAPFHSHRIHKVIRNTKALRPEDHFSPAKRTVANKGVWMWFSCSNRETAAVIAENFQPISCPIFAPSVEEAAINDSCNWRRRRTQKPSFPRLSTALTEHSAELQRLTPAAYTYRARMWVGVCI